MNIYLIRHSDAEKSSASKKDFDRELTEDGKEKIKSAAEGWKNLIKSFDIMVSSPLKRAVQTANIIAEVFKFGEKIIIDKRITCGSSTDDLIELVNSLDGNNIALVGHEPDFSNHISNLISSSGMYIDFKKGTIAKIVFQNRVKYSKGILEFLIPPKIFKNELLNG